MVKAGKVFLIIGVIALIATIVSGFGLTKSVKDMTKFLSEGVPISGSGTVSMTQGDERAIWGSNSASGQCSVKGPSGATVPIVPIDAHFQNQEIDWKALGTFKASSTGDHTVTCPGSSTYLVTDQFDIGKIGGMVGWTLGLTLGGVIAFIGLVLGLILFLVGRNKR